MATASRFSHRAIPRLLIVLALALAAAAPLGRPRAATAAGVAADLFFSEYVEGTSNNKALEIFNGTGAPVDLAAGGYMVQMYLNGNTTPSLALPLNGTVVAGDVFVLARSTAAAAILAQADQTSTSTSWYNGDDAVVLRKGGAGGPILDVIGQIGFDPGAEWGAGLTSTADNTLRRKPSVLAGDTNGADAFDPAVEWDGFAVDTFGGLGSHTVSGGSAPIIPSCGGPLVTGVGTAATRDVSASDADGVVTQAAITAINPSPSGGSITLAPVSPAPSPGDALTATLNVSAAVPAGIYNTTITFKNSDAPAQQSAICLVQVAVGMSAPGLRIHDIQGARHTSPISGTLVIDVPGVVTAKRSNGFYMQDPEPDALDATSEGIFVYTTTAPTVVVSDSVQVSGKVVEFRPGGDATNLTTTEIDTGGDPSKVVTVGVAAPPPPTVIGAGGRLPPTQVIEDDAGGDAEAGGVFDPASDGLDFYESLEGMLVQVDDAVAVGPTSSDLDIPLLAGNGAGAGVRSARGGIVIGPGDFNPERIILDNALVPLGVPRVSVGDRFGGPIVGVIDYSFGNYKLLNRAALPAVLPANLARETTAPPAAGQLSVATFNVENLSPGDGPAKFDRLAALIVTNLQSPDLIAVEEVQDNNGTAGGTVDASVTLATLIDAIKAAGGPIYQYCQINPVINQDGGAPGGNIRQVFLFRTDRGLAFVPRPGGTPTSATTVVSGPGGPQLSFSPGRIDPTNPAFADSRKPLAAEFTFDGRPIFAIANHFNSKIGDQPLFGRTQPPVRSSEIKRNQQAQIVADFVKALLAQDPAASVIVLGDLNDYQFSDAVVKLKGSSLADLVETLPPAERYTYVFEGNSQAIDHIMVSASLRDAEYDVVHVNAEFYDQASDHDPSVALLRPGFRVRLPLAVR